MGEITRSVSAKEAGVDTHDLLWTAMHAFVKMTLLFHSVSPWDLQKREEWIALEMQILRLPSAHHPIRKYATGQVTTKALCDYGRIILR